MYSTNVSVVDSDGTALTGATVTYTVDGGASAACDEITAGDYACGMEEAGHFVISAELDGFAAGSAEVDVGADECHVEPEAVSITLEPLECTAEVVASVLVHLVGSSGETLDNPQVAYTLGDTAAPIACTSSDGVDWVCGNDEWGDFVIDAVAGGHVAESVDVVVLPDAAECHPVTESIEVSLDWAPD